jgi:hypothetical protein
MQVLNSRGYEITKFKAKLSQLFLLKINLKKKGKFFSRKIATNAGSYPQRRIAGDFRSRHKP